MEEIPHSKRRDAGSICGDTVSHRMKAYRTADYLPPPNRRTTILSHLDPVHQWLRTILFQTRHHRPTLHWSFVTPSLSP
jgi:hypothetical protein